MMFDLWIEVLMLNFAAFLIGIGIAWLCWGRRTA
jgi:hypothetical protein